MRLQVQGLGLRRQGKAVLQDISFTMGAGEVVGLIGPNGAGKSTLMRAVQGLLAHEGQSSLMALNPRDRAKAAAFMPQEREVAWGLSVRDVVALGRIAHGGRDPDGEVARAIERLQLQGLASRSALDLSGGELARVLLARLLAQGTPLILADEPAAGLDPEHQIRVMELFQALAQEGRGVLVSLHDLGLAVRHCTRLILMDQGRILADGPPGQVLDDQALARTFGIRVHRAEAEGPVLAPIGLAPSIRPQNSLT